MGDSETTYEVAYATCCRIWPVAKYNPIQSCGLCYQVPTIKQNLTKQDYENWRRPE